MSTNDNPEVVEETNDAPVTEDDLRNLKYPEDEVETSEQEEDESPEEETEGEEETEETEEAETPEAEETEEQSEEPPAFVKQFPNIKGDTPEEYAKNLEIAYQNSTSEALRLKKLTEATVNQKPADTPIGEVSEEDTAPAATSTTNVSELWVNSQMDKAISEAFTKFKEDYPQVADPELYDKFTEEVATFSQISLSKGEAPDPEKLYAKAAISLGWEKQSVPTEKEKLGMAVKSSVASSKVVSSGAKPTSKSKVTDAHIAAHRKMTGSTASDAEIRKELESHIT